MWLFGNGIWIDIGFDEDATKVSSSFEEIASALERLSGGGVNELVYYHIHPRRIYLTGIYPPCIYDIYALATLKARCAKLAVQTLTGILFDGYGRWIFDISGELEQRLSPQEFFCPAALRASPKRNKEWARLSFYISHESRVGSILHNPTASKAEIIQEYIKAVEELGVFLRYEEIE